jgi:hypothetical protein
MRSDSRLRLQTDRSPRRPRAPVAAKYRPSRPRCEHTSPTPAQGGPVSPIERWRACHRGASAALSAVLSRASARCSPVRLVTDPYNSCEFARSRPLRGPAAVSGRTRQRRGVWCQPSIVWESLAAVASDWPGAGADSGCRERRTWERSSDMRLGGGRCFDRHRRHRPHGCTATLPPCCKSVLTEVSGNT